MHIPHEVSIMNSFSEMAALPMPETRHQHEIMSHID